MIPILMAVPFKESLCVNLAFLLVAIDSESDGHSPLDVVDVGEHYDECLGPEGRNLTDQLDVVSDHEDEMAV